MELLVFQGNRGMGKTLGMVLYAKYLQEHTGCSLFSNFPMNGSDGFYSFDDFKKVATCENSILLLDECHNDLDGRDSQSRNVKYLTHMIFYLRKLRCTMLLTTPLFRSIAGQVRDVTNIVVCCSKNRDYFFYDFWDNDNSVFLKRRNINREKALVLCDSVYDTKGIVSPLKFPEDRNGFVKLLEEIKQINEMHTYAYTLPGGEADGSRSWI